MAQMGLLDPDELNKAIETGILPTKEESLENQKEYIKNRKNGLYTPLLGGNDMSQQDSSKKSGSDQFNGQTGWASKRDGNSDIKQKSFANWNKSIRIRYRGQKFSVSKIVDLKLPIFLKRSFQGRQEKVED